MSNRISLADGKFYNRLCYLRTQEGINTSTSRINIKHSCFSEIGLRVLPVISPLQLNNFNFRLQSFYLKSFVQYMENNLLRC